MGVHYRGTDGVGHTEFVAIEKYLKASIANVLFGDIGFYKIIHQDLIIIPNDFLANQW